MLAQGDIAALLEARHPDPFAVLGLHADQARDGNGRVVLSVRVRVD